MLVELAVGDAYGAGFEYADRDFLRAHNTLDRYVKHPRHAIAPGRYSDNTQMTIAIAEAIVEGDPWTPSSLAERFVAVFKRDPREGYAAGFYQFLTAVESGTEFLARIRPASDKSGAAMRAGPIGILPTPTEVIARAAGSCCDEIAQDLPEALLWQLEHGSYGHDYLAALDDRLLALVQR